MDAFASLHQLDNLGLLALRIGVGVIFVVHGVLKFGMWKMQPSEKLSARMLSQMRLLSVVEPLGGAAVILGFLTQLASAGLAIIMIGAIGLKAGTMHKDFAGDGGWEFDFILLAAAIALVFIGGGPLALDRLLFGI